MELVEKRGDIFDDGTDVLLAEGADVGAGVVLDVLTQLLEGGANVAAFGIDGAGEGGGAVAEG